MSGYEVVSPFTGSISADGTAQIEAINRETFTYTGNADYEINATGLSTIKDFFSLTQETDSSSNVLLNVSVTDAAALAGALRTAWVDGTAKAFGASNSVLSFQTVLAKIHEDAFNASLATNGVNAALEAGSVRDISFGSYSEDVLGDSTTGMTKLANDMKTGDNGESLRLLALQLPASNYDTSNGAAMPATIPFADGDTLRIRFTVASVFDLQTNAQDKVTDGAVGGGTASDHADGAPDAQSGLPTNNVLIGSDTTSLVVDLIIAW
jgi:hypothetical protein